MNNHINISRAFGGVRKPFRNSFDVVEFDHMPVEVATEMLCAPKARMTNRERKECQRAREIRYAPSTPREKKPLELRLANRFSYATCAQLTRWLRRAQARRLNAQHLYEHLGRQIVKLGALPETPVTKYAALVAERKRAELDLMAAHFEAFSDAAREELLMRQNSNASLEQNN